MTEAAFKHVDVDYSAGSGESADDYPSLDDKFDRAIDVAHTALIEYDHPAILWTGGKDSTLVVYVVHEVAREFDLPMPPTVFIDHFQHFAVVEEFLERWAEEWDLELIRTANADVGNIAGDPGEPIAISDLNERNQQEVREKLEYEDDSFPFLLDTYVGNHLLKTVPLNDVIEREGFDGIISGVRWDEQEARGNETFFSPRHDSAKYPPHDRVHPILQFDEADLWEAMWHYVVPDTVEGFPDDGYIPTGEDDLPEGLTAEDIPVSPKYWEGFRSLGSEVSTTKSDDQPAWLQDLAGTTERAGRAQDKEKLMERLRDLGYM